RLETAAGGGATIAGALVFAQAVNLPIVLVRGRNRDDDPDKRLLDWKEATDAAQALAATALNKLHDDLRNIEIKHDGSTTDGVVADFLGITQIAGIAQTKFSVEINPEGLLDVDTGELVFRASGEALFDGGFTSPFASGAVTAAVRIEVALTRSGLLQLLPSIDVPELPHF